jgi:DnaJ-class molecular chaperone
MSHLRKKQQQTVVCSQCRGSGNETIVVKQESCTFCSFQPNDPMWNVPCPMCFGKKIIIHYAIVNCRRCNGKGYVTY